MDVARCSRAAHHLAHRLRERFCCADCGKDKLARHKNAPGIPPEATWGFWSIGNAVRSKPYVAPNFESEYKPSVEAESIDRVQVGGERSVFADER